MSSRIALPMEAQASALVSFLAQAQHTLSPDTALEICSTMRAAKEPAARFLKAALARHGFELKHTSCLKALALMDGFEGHVSRPKLAWVVAQYTFDAPANTPRVKRHNKSTDASSDLCTRLTKELEGTKAAPYARVLRNPDYLEFVFLGEPLGGVRYILACKSPDGSACEMPEDEVVSTIERVRRVIEGQFRGWLDGALRVPVAKAGILRLLKDGVGVASGFESEVLAACERDEDFALEAASLLGLPASSRRYSVAHVLATNGEIVPAEDEVVERMWRRLEAFYRGNEFDYSWFVAQRLQEEAEALFYNDGVDTERLMEELAKHNLTAEDARTCLGMNPEEWSALMESEEVSRKDLFALCGLLELPSANELYFDLRSPPWLPVVDGKEVALWMRNFDHFRLSVSGVAQGTSFGRWVVEQLEKLNGRNADPLAIQDILDKAEARGLCLCATIEKRFVSDLPIPRERLAMVGHLSLWDRKEVEKLGPADIADESDGEGASWTAMDDEYLLRFNMLRMTVEDLANLQKEVERARQDGQGPGWETVTFAAARVFKGRSDAPHRAHTAVTRMTALSRLMASGVLAMWLEQSSETSAQLVPANVFQAAAECPLIRVGNDVGFDPETFRLMALEFVE
jgi:hypothetical protein